MPVCFDWGGGRGVFPALCAELSRSFLYGGDGVPFVCIVSDLGYDSVGHLDTVEDLTLIVAFSSDPSLHTSIGRVS